MSSHPTFRREEAGMALIIAILVLLMASSMGLAALEHAGGEAASTGHKKRTAITFYAADAGLNYGRSRVVANPPDLEPFQLAMSDGTRFRSGTREDGAPVEINAPDFGPPPDGFSINIGGAGGFVSQNTTLNVTAEGSANSLVELETRISQTVAGYGRY